MKRTYFVKALLIALPCILAFSMLFLLIDSASADMDKKQNRVPVGDLLLGLKANFPLLSPPLQINPAMIATLRAESGEEIRFQTNNGGAGSVRSEIPHLVLFRDGILTPPISRTLTVTVENIQVPLAGVTVTLQVDTQHQNPDLLPGGIVPPIRVWDESRWISNTWGAVRNDVSITFDLEFVEMLPTGDPTPTDYFLSSVFINGNPAILQDYAFLMENQWMEPLPTVQEDPVGSAPDSVLIYYTDMIPFAADTTNRATFLPRASVPAYISETVASVITGTFGTEVNDWGMGPWYEYDGFEQLTVAINDYSTWFHGAASNSSRTFNSTDAHLSLSPSGVNQSWLRRYVGSSTSAADDLMNGFEATTYHEMFHVMERNIKQNQSTATQRDNLGWWDFVIEGQSVWASSVGQPVLQFNANNRQYMAWSNAFLRDLNRSYTLQAQGNNGYQGGIYWRFLYEQCGGLSNLLDGTRVIEVAFEEYSRVFSASGSITNTVTTDLPPIMDAVFANPDVSLNCPFTTYAESLQAFAQNNYALRLDGGRCTNVGVPAGCGYYDPNNLYVFPPLSLQDNYTYQQDCF